MDPIVERALSGDARSLARLVSEIERHGERATDLMKEIYPHTGRAHTIGITGSPGAGKSTLAARLIAKFREQGKRVGIIAVDPSSPYTGGAILGDRLRMQEHALDSGVFIRSMGSRGSLGGLSSATHEAALILDACGYDIVVIETVGVGQSEVDVVKVSDTVVLVLVPGMGDDVQIMKAGIMEIADVFVVNKSDRDGAEKVAADVKVMLDLMPARDWRPPVSLASAEHNKGIDAAIANIDSHRNYLNETEDGRSRKIAKIRTEVEDIIKREVLERVAREWDRALDGGVLELIEARKSDPYTVAAECLGKIIV
jgi:LAO/AO transport system kinase